MNYTITKQKNWHTVIHVTVTSEKIKPELEDAFNDYQKNIKLEGFRKGKVPAQLVKKMFGKQIEKETFQPYFAEAWKTATEENKFNYLNEPIINNVLYNDQDGLTFDIEFDERPEFTVTGFDGIAVDKVTFEITDDDVKHTLENLQQRHAMIYSVEGEAKEDHLLITDLQETDAGGVPIVGSRYQDQQIFLKSNEELIKQLVGVKPGEERKLVLTMQSKEEGAEPTPPQHFIVKVKEIKERRLPELDDEFAKDLGSSFNTIAELKKDIKERLKQQATQTAEFQFKKDLVDELIKKMDLEVPPSMLETYMNALVQDFKKSNNPYSNLDDKQVRDYYHDIAVRTIKWIMIREKLVEQLNITVSDKELEEKLAQLQTEDQHEHQADEQHEEHNVDTDHVKDKLLEEKVYEFLISKAKINKVKKSWRAESEKAAAAESE